MNSQSIRYSFVVPIFNDAELASRFCHEFERVFQSYLKTNDIHREVELLFVSDGSREDQFEILVNSTRRFAFVKLIELSRNFGQHVAITAGYDAAQGEFIGMLNVDMEDPPSQIPILLDRMKSEGLDFACGVYQTRRISFIQKLTSALFYRLINLMTGYGINPNAATLRIMRREFLDAYQRLNEKVRFLPLLEKWLGFKQQLVPITHQPRQEGTSTYNLKRRLTLAVDTIITFTDIPLKFTVYVGMVLALIGFALIGVLIIQKLFILEMRPGYSSTMAAIIFLGGIQILTLGMASLYIGRVLKEVQNRPLYLVRRKVNCGVNFQGHRIAS